MRQPIRRQLFGANEVRAVVRSRRAIPDDIPMTWRPLPTFTAVTAPAAEKDF